MFCVFCHADLTDTRFATNYGPACHKACAAAGLVHEAVKCVLKTAPCFGHSKQFCTGVADLQSGTPTSAARGVCAMLETHRSWCRGRKCPLPHSPEAILQLVEPAAPAAAPAAAPSAAPLKRKVTAEDAAHVLRCFRAKHDPPNFTADLARIMRDEGVPDMQPMLDAPGTVGPPCFPSRHACTAGDVVNIVRIYRFHLHLSQTRNFTMSMKAVMRQEGFPELEHYLDKYIV